MRQREPGVLLPVKYRVLPACTNKPYAATCFALRATQDAKKSLITGLPRLLDDSVNMAAKAKKRTYPTQRKPVAHAQQKSAGKYVYLFDEIRLAERAAGSWDGLRGLLGGKGANLA